MASLRKILIMTGGSRGDVQPYIAIALALKCKGYDVAIASNVNHKEFCQHLGIQFFGTFIDSDNAVKESATIRKSMAEGQTFVFLKGFGEVVAKKAKESFDNLMTVVEDFKPDLMVEGSLSEYYGAVANYMLHIPCIPVHLQYLGYDPERMGWGLPTLCCGLHKMLVKEVVKGIWDGVANSTAKFVEHKFPKQPTLATIITRKIYANDSLNPPVPILIGQSPEVMDAISTVKKPALIKFCGPCVIKKEQQTGDNFGTAERPQLERFINAGPKPVYCGWGSMTCRSPEYMIEFVIRALMLSGQRAIVLKGWANLTEESLKKATNDEALLEFARGNVFFVSSASHEWLFPQCVCTVHHGGSGTINAALRAGVPTIITPVFLDQYDHAYAVNNLGVGVGFAKQFQKISPHDLSNAIKHVVTDTKIQKNAANLSKRLLAEDGASTVAVEVEGFWKDWVKTGKLEKHVNKRIMTARQSCFAWCAWCR